MEHFEIAMNLTVLVGTGGFELTITIHDPQGFKPVVCPGIQERRFDLIVTP